MAILPTTKKEGTETGAAEEQVSFEALADPYPLDAYITPEGKVIRWGWGEPGKYKDRCELRIRSMQNVSLPAGMLKKGLNVLAIEVHRAPYAEGFFNISGWWEGFQCHAGLLSACLLVEPSEGVTPNVSRPKGFQVWSANPMMAVFDMDYGNPVEQLNPIRIYGVRNGSFSGQVVVSCDTAIKGLRAELSELVRSDDSTQKIPASAVQIRYALPSGFEGGSEIRYGTREVLRFDTLAESPLSEVPVYTKTQGLKPNGAVQPIWITVTIPRDIPAGEYHSDLTIHAEEQKDTIVPVIVKVADWTLPDAKDYITFTDLIQSPESVAMHYNVPLWSEKHWELIEKTFCQLGRIGNKTVYIPMICKTHFGNTESMVRWVKQSDGKYKGDFTLMEKYLDIAQKYLGKPPVVCLYLWDHFAGGGYFSAKTDPTKWSKIPVSLLDLATGQVTMFETARYSEPEAEQLWKPITDELMENIKKRGLENSLMVGICSDVRADKIVVDLWKKLLPGAKWVIHSHGLEGQLHGVPVGYSATVWKTDWPADPDVRRTYGWARDAWNRKNMGFVTMFHRDLVFGYNLTQNRLLAENNIGGGQVGFGRNGADFWPPYTDKQGRKTGFLANRFPESNWAQLSVKTCFLAPGPNGALSTIRWEMTIEGVQECEARIFIEKVLHDKSKCAIIGEEMATRLQKMLDERIRTALWGWNNYGWYVSSGWQERSAELYAAAAELEKTLTIQGKLTEFKKMVNEGKKDETVKTCRKFINASEEYPYMQSALLAYLVEILGDNAFDDVVSTLNKKNSDARAPLVKVATSLINEGLLNKWVETLKKSKPYVRAGIIETFSACTSRIDKTAMLAVKQCLSDTNESVRIAAIVALAKQWGKESVKELANVLQSGTQSEREAVVRELTQIPSDEINKAIADVISSAEPVARSALLDILARRNAIAQIDTVISATADKNESVRISALKALNVFGDEITLPLVLGLLTRATSEEERQVAEVTAKGICARVKDPTKCFLPVKNVFNSATPSIQCSLLRILGKIGDTQSLQVVLNATRDQNPEIQDTAIHVLSAWNSIDAADRLIEIVRTSTKDSQKLAAHQGYSRLVVMSDNQSDIQKIQRIKVGLETALRPDEKGVLLSGLTKLNNINALKLAEKYFDEDASIQKEASMVIVSIAEEVSKTDRSSATSALKKVIEKVKDKNPARSALERIEMYDDYIGSWKISEPYVEEGKNFMTLMDTVFPPEQNAKDVTWKPISSDGNSAWQLDIARIISQKDTVVYLQVTVESQIEQEVQMQMGSTGPIKVWINGTEVFIKKTNRAIKPGEDKVKVNLKQGDNIVLVKSATGNTGWAVCVRFRSTEGSKLANVQVKAE